MIKTFIENKKVNISKIIIRIKILMRIKILTIKNCIINKKNNDGKYYLGLISTHHSAEKLPLFNHTNTVQKKVMFQTKVCTKVGNSLLPNFVMIRKRTLFSVKMVTS